MEFSIYYCVIYSDKSPQTYSKPSLLEVGVGYPVKVNTSQGPGLQVMVHGVYDQDNIQCRALAADKGRDVPQKKIGPQEGEQW